MKNERRRGPCWRVLAVGALLATATVHDAPAGAVTEGPRAVYVSTDVVKAPQLLADGTGRLHLFFLAGRNTGSRYATDRLMYATWWEGRWSKPVIVQQRANHARLDLASVTLDSAGWIHAVWQAAPSGRLYYARVYATRAAERSAWTGRATLTAGRAFRSQLRSDDRGRLHFAYASGGSDVYYRQSTDGGRSWTDAVAVSRVAPDVEATDYPRLAVDEHGVIHLVWSQFTMPRGVPPSGVYYSRSSDGGLHWTTPRRLAGKNRSQINVQTRGEREVHVVWNSVVAVGDRKYSWSADGGDTWSAAIDFPAGIRGGLTGPAPLVLDAADALHVVSSVDGPDRVVERVVTLSFADGAWSAPEWLSDGCGATNGVERPSAAVLLGDRLHTVFDVDNRAIYHSITALAAPHVAPQPLPTMRVPTLSDRVRGLSPQFLVFAGTALLVVGTALRQLFLGRAGGRR